jgi:hypothetical protein
MTDAEPFDRNDQDAADRADAKARIVEQLLAGNLGAQRDTCVQYADALLEYREATDNIENHGIIVQHPRTLNPFPNPYLPIRDRALKKLQDFVGLDAAALW